MYHKSLGDAISNKIARDISMAKQVSDVSALKKHLKPGDIFLSKVNSDAPASLGTALSKVIGYVTGSPWVHTGVYKGDGEVIHSYSTIKDKGLGGPKMVRTQKLNEVAGVGRDILILRPTDLDAKQKREALTRMNSLEGLPYSNVGLIAGADLFPRGKGNMDQERLKKLDSAICTTAVGWAYKGLDFDKPLKNLNSKDFLEHKDLKPIAVYEKKASMDMLNMPRFMHIDGLLRQTAWLSRRQRCYVSS